MKIKFIWFFFFSFLKSNGSSPSAETQMNWADAYVIVYSICDTCSFDRAKSLLDTISKVRSNSYIPVLLLGNKTDLEHRRTVGVEEGHQVALEYNCQYYEVSAAENYVTINIAFQALLRDAKMNQQQKSMLKRRRTSLVNVSKKLGAMFSGKKDCAEFDKRRTSMDVNSPLKLTWTSARRKCALDMDMHSKQEICKRNENNPALSVNCLNLQRIRLSEMCRENWIVKQIVNRACCKKLYFSCQTVRFHTQLFENKTRVPVCAPLIWERRPFPVMFLTR